MASGLALLLATLSHAAEDPTKSLQQTLQSRYPDVKIEAVQATPIPGLYEVIAGGRTSYADASGNYMILGRLVDTRTRQDLSAEHLDAHNAIDFGKLPFDRAIKIVKGNGSRHLALFEDPDCPYCRQLEKDLRSVSDVTIYVFLFPLESVHPNATAHAHAIWCSPDHARTWTDWMVDNKAPAGPASCDGDPVNDLQSIGASLKVSATPTLFLQNGRRVSGAVSAETLEQMLTAAAGKVGAAAGAAGKVGAVTGAPGSAGSTAAAAYPATGS